MSRDCCVALPRNAMSLSAFVIVIFPDHSHLLFLIVFITVTNLTVFVFVCFIAANLLLS